MGELGNHLPQQLEPLSFQVRCNRGQPCDVSAGVREALDETRANGSPTAIMTSGIDRACFLTAREAGVPAVTIISTFWGTNSPMRAGKRSYFPSAHRYSIKMFLPST